MKGASADAASRTRAAATALIRFASALGKERAVLFLPIIQLVRETLETLIAEDEAFV
jgi:hypothetical protein